MKYVLLLTLLTFGCKGEKNAAVKGKTYDLPPRTYIIDSSNLTLTGKDSDLSAIPGIRVVKPAYNKVIHVSGMITGMGIGGGSVFVHPDSTIEQFGIQTQFYDTAPRDAVPSGNHMGVWSLLKSTFPKTLFIEGAAPSYRSGPLAVGTDSTIGMPKSDTITHPDTVVNGRIFSWDYWWHGYDLGDTVRYVSDSIGLHKKWWVEDIRFFRNVFPYPVSAEDSIKNGNNRIQDSIEWAVVNRAMDTLPKSKIVYWVVRYKGKLIQVFNEIDCGNFNYKLSDSILQGKKQKVEPCIIQ